MFIQQLKLRNFRNYRNYSLNFNQAITVISGVNGVGKTNLLEAIYYIASARSFRTSESVNLVEVDCEYASIEVLTEDFKLMAIIGSEEKKFYYERTLIKTLSEYIGLLPVIIFAPNDLFFLSQPPKVRRRMIDGELSKINKAYLVELSKYNQLIKNRNILLKQDDFDHHLLLVIDETMSEIMTKIRDFRKNYIQRINQSFSQTYDKLANQKTNLKINYICSVGELDQNQIFATIQQNQNRDIVTKQTNIGIHRDDYQIIMEDQLVKDHCSQGQMRMLMLALKLTFAEIIEETSAKKPIILLDDVLSELDLNNQKRLFKLINNYQQTIITTTHLDTILLNNNYQLIKLS